MQLEKLALWAACVAAAAPALAQPAAPPSFGSRAYAGAGLGQALWDNPCVPGFSCEDVDVAFKLYAGVRVREMFGAELAYVDMGRVDLGAGEARAFGLNLSLVGNLPVARHLSLFGKLGSTWGRTRVSAPAAVSPSGRESDLGLSYGLGFEWEFMRNLGLRAEWERHGFQFAGGREDDIDFWTVGVSYRF